MEKIVDTPTVAPSEAQPEENNQHQRTLTFNDDGTIDPEQLVGMPQEMIDRCADPEFQARVREYIAAEKARVSFHRGARQIRDLAMAEGTTRRPAGVSGRQRKRLRRLARRMNAGGVR
jgi:hypothetical protein